MHTSTFPRISLVLCLLSIASLTATAADGSSACAMTSEQREALLDLPFATFDQLEGSGWRPLYEARCYAQAAELVSAYIQRNPNLIERHPELANQAYILPAHAGQMYALAGDNERAIAYLLKAYQTTSQSFINWNAYMSATIAFLRRDKDELLKQRELIALQQPMRAGRGVPEWMVGKKLNLDVVDRFIACFDKSFEAGFRDGCKVESEPQEGVSQRPAADMGRSATALW
jgi:tetratricopeptide (TPR) repeat protein